ncbi:hypothetical protein ABEV00_01355 [Paenibacillus thiaminolyticus]|uniref:hypothetical protein n=1 Tax=Paenibacillus TaxID=44249 RepID=UPI001059B233|nr:hypothetical protein [Paenibacillus dendritiformis]TDL57514.1 hypothetical protein E2R60_03145 [Paenibacillus dendritiformis]
MPYEAKTDWKYDDLVTEKDMNRIEQGLKDAHVPAYQPLTLTPGLQVVEVENDTPFRMGEIKGRTLVNLLGRAGGCEDVSLWADSYTSHILNSTNKTSGLYGMKVSFTGVTGSGLVHIQKVPLKAGKYYVALVDLKNSNAAELCLNFNHINSTLATDVSKFTTVHIRLSPSEDITSNFHVLINGETNCYGYMDSARLYEITEAEYKAIASMTPEQVAERFPYVDSMTNIKNPYTIVTGGNLLPPFYDGWYSPPSFVITGPYTALIKAAGNYESTYKEMTLLPNTDYTFSAEHNGWIGVFLPDSKTAVAPYTREETVTFNSGSNTVVRFFFSNVLLGPGMYTFRNPILTVGRETKNFVPQQRSMLAFETELVANPIDGSNPDTLYIGDDGLPYVLEKWGKVTLDLIEGVSSFLSGVGHRTVVFILKDIAVKDEGILVKYDGKMLSLTVYGQPATDADQFVVGTSDVHMQISHTDSGWGPDYSPTVDELKAYFLGWKMGIVGQPRTVLYNGEGGKVWYKISMCTVNASHSLSREDWVEYNTPTYPAGVDSVGTFNHPYRLQYLKAQPTVEPVYNYEMGATLCAGSNMVEVGSGIVLRERANPAYISGYGWYVADKTRPESCLRYSPKHIYYMYRNKNFDPSWEKLANSNSQGFEKVKIPEERKTQFDPTAIYFATYTMLDPTLPSTIPGTIAKNLPGTVSDLVQDVGSIDQRLSVVETLDIRERDTGWIFVTPLNGWVHYPKKKCCFRVVGNKLYLRGLLQDGTATKTTMFSLPINTSEGVWEKVATWSGSDNVNNIQVNLTPNGNMNINAGSALKYVSFDGLVIEYDRLEVL